MTELFKNALIERHGAELQEKISSAAVAVCGLGGIGSHTAMLLARMGVGHLHLIDFDKVDISNINRQNYSVCDVGTLKTVACGRAIQNAAPTVCVSTHNARLDSESIPFLLADDDIICECFDSAECKSELVNTVFERMPEKYVVSTSGMAGACDGNSIVTRRFGSRFFVCGDGESDVADSCLFAPRVALCAAHQALAVLQIIIERKTK